MDSFSVSFNCELEDVNGVKELFKMPKRYKMRMVLNDTEDKIKELCKNKDAELVLGESRFKILDFPTYFKEWKEQGIYVYVEQII